MIPLRLVRILLLGLLATATLRPVGLRAQADTPAPASEDISFFRDIRPIFQEHCHGCHQPAKQGGDYVMTQFATLVQGGESGQAAVVPGKPDASYLIEQITPDGDSAAMPKDRPPLTDTERTLITRWIAAGAKDDSPASTRDRYDMDHPPEYPAPPVITALEFSPDGTELAISGYHEVVIRSSDGGQILARLVGLSERIESAVYSADGTKLAVTGGSPGRMGEVQIWNVKDKALLLSLTVGYDTCYGAAWSPDGKLIAFGCPDNTSRALEAATGRQVFFNGAHNDWVLDTVFSTQGDHLITVSRDMSMKLIHVPTQRFIDNITSITPGALKGGLNCIDRHPSQDQLLAGGSDGVPKIYKMVREMDRKIGDDFNLVRSFAPMPGRIFDVAYSRDGKLVVAGSSDNTRGEVRVYNEADARQLMAVPLPTGIYAVDLHPDGTTVAAGGFDGLVRILRVADGQVLAEFPPVPLAPPAASAASATAAPR
jgi:mono/diheme cytochrome c family protein